MIEFECPNCGLVLQVPSKHAGKKGTCKRCHTKLVIPNGITTADDQADTTAALANNPAKKQKPASLIGTEFRRPVNATHLIGMGLSLLFMFAFCSCCGILPSGWPFFRAARENAPLSTEFKSTPESLLKVDVFVDDSISSLLIGGEPINLNGTGGTAMLKAGSHQWTATGSEKWKSFCTDEWKEFEASDASKTGQVVIKSTGRNLLMLSMFNNTDAKPSSPNKDDVIGIWIQAGEPFPGRITLFKHGNKLIMEKIYAEGGVGTDLMVDRSDDMQRKFFKAKKFQPESDFYLIDGNEDLQLWSADTDGKHVLVVTANKITPP